MGHPELTDARVPWDPAVRSLDEDWTATVQAIVSGGMWCVIETRTDVGAQSWEPALLVCSAEEETVSGALAAWIGDFPGQDLRICGYTRDSLRRVDDAPSAVCYLAATA